MCSLSQADLVWRESHGHGEWILFPLLHLQPFFHAQQWFLNMHLTKCCCWCSTSVGHSRICCDNCDSRAGGFVCRKQPCEWKSWQKSWTRTKIEGLLLLWLPFLPLCLLFSWCRSPWCCCNVRMERHNFRARNCTRPWMNGWKWTNTNGTNWQKPVVSWKNGRFTKYPTLAVYFLLSAMPWHGGSNVKKTLRFIFSFFSFLLSSLKCSVMNVSFMLCEATQLSSDFSMWSVSR